MAIRKRLLAAAGILAAIGAMAYAAAVSRAVPGTTAGNGLLHRPTLTLWYTDEKLEDYLASVALDYQNSRGVQVIPVLKSGLEYLEEVNRASLEAENAPDIYIVSNDSLEKANLSGLAAEVKDRDSVLTTDFFPQTALDAVSYQGQKMAYPLYFETSALIYNKTYLEQAAQELGTDVASLIPQTIEGIQEFADVYNAPETVESVFRWDVSDFFYNYFFAGNYINVGGSCGDDASRIDIYNLEAVEGLTAYQDLSQFFSIDAETSSYEQVVQDFLSGKLVFTIATTDILERAKAAKADGSFAWEYGVAPLPDIDESVCTRGISVTNAVAVNGYSKKRDKADAFASWLATEGAAKLYDRTGHVPALQGAASQNAEMAAFWQEYSSTVPMPKLMSTANFWIQMEAACTKIWKGENVSDVLKSLSEKIMTQVTGAEYMEAEYMEAEYIELPEETESGFEDGAMD